MAIAPYLEDFDVDPETKRVLEVALEMTRAALGLADDFANGIIAKQIIEQLQEDGPPSIGVDNRGYTFSAAPNGAT